MAVEMLYEKDVTTNYLQGKKFCFVGYGSQGHAQANNLRDSGYDVTVGVRPGASFEAAKRDGFDPKPVAEAVKDADVIQMLTPDEVMAEVYKNDVEPNMKKGATLGFSHGFNIYYKEIVPPADSDVIMMAPKGPGNLAVGLTRKVSGFQHFTLLTKMFLATPKTRPRNSLRGTGLPGPAF